MSLESAEVRDLYDVHSTLTSGSRLQTFMVCPRCKIKMTEQKRSYHKQRKWVCPQCGAARMQAQKPRPPRGAEK